MYFKDENPTDFIKEFIGLRSKLYAIKTVSRHEDKKAKGYNNKFKESILTCDNYKKCQEDLSFCRFPLITIHGEDQQLYTILQNELVLNDFDAEMYICNCNVHPYFYGSNHINSICNICN